MAKKPTSVTLFAYQVGFGDCFLLRFGYPDRDRHVLIDFGTTGLPEDAMQDTMLRVATDIELKCGEGNGNGKLDAIVATHRHADHISGFATNAKKSASGDVIRKLSPRLVVQPWTEHPRLKTDATQLPKPLRNAGNKGFVRSLDRMHRIAEQAADAAQGKPGRRFTPFIRQQLSFIGQDNLKNMSAVKNLMTMAENEYVHFGYRTKLGGLLPGVKVRVLGPPTLAQTDTIRKQRSKDEDEFWQFHALTAREQQGFAADGDLLFPRAAIAPGSKLPASARWLTNRVREAVGDQMLQLVRILDNQMNNTSVILLFEVGGKKLLFPGDAQLENWQYALGKKAIRTALEDVDLYKVGHHGSLNATPKSMWALLKNRGPKSKSGRLTSVMSTMPDKHGKEENNTEVPRRTLVRALKAESDLHSTHELAPNSLYEELDIL